MRFQLHDTAVARPLLMVLFMWFRVTLLLAVVTKRKATKSWTLINSLDHAIQLKLMY